MSTEAAGVGPIMSNSIDGREEFCYTLKIMSQTTIPQPRQLNREWRLVDAKGQTLGRLASRIVLVLRGKHKATFTPFLDTGDFVVVINAQHIRVTGQKVAQKLYQRYSGYPGGRTVQPLSEVLQRYPDRIVRQAVKGMLPDGPLGRQVLRHLKVYPGAEHPHQAQNPTPLHLTKGG